MNKENSSQIDPFEEISNFLKNGFRIADGLQMKIEDGNIYYSNDDGETWSQDLPKNFISNGSGAIMKQE